MVHNFSLFCKKKHTFSILHAHFYKTSPSIYLLYTLFYINNIFFVLLSPNPQILCLSLFPNPQTHSSKLCLSLIPQSLCISNPSSLSLILQSLISLTSFFSQFSLIQNPHTHRFSLSLLSLCHRSLHCWISLI